MSLDDLRQAAIDQDDPIVSSSNFDDPVIIEDDDDRLFGMNAIERMFLSIGLFGIVLILSFLLLLVTDSIAFNF